MRVRTGVIGGVMMTTLLALAGAASAAPDDVKWLGVHGAYYSKYEKAAVGITARQYSVEELRGEFSVGFLLDYVFRSGGSTWVTGADLQYERYVAHRRFSLWTGAGGGVVRDDRHGPNQEAE